ncbi:hypothetical protein BDB00DRAFT_510596 [Zychaea mexicana]|uniref:uncharacterized protein n=1 Tax=Zychaea mexicana TaxID=64656 RepID=UPI0022FE104D|nr:uncharacterized protein BDB00DRAFT_510596 [Zychaea mexicana]KAI9491173.1 hypothetical protein BDB00DRAFT_510596 [Zychaea mexicana]
MDGGFFGNNDSSFNSGGGSTSSRKPMGEQTLRAVTVKQLANCTITQEGTFKVDNVDLTQVTFVGVIRNVTELSTNISYAVEDGTGKIEVRLWLDQSETAEDAQKRRDLTEDTYVRVFGRLNNFNNKVNVVAFTIRPVKDYNEINYHFVEATLTHVKFTNPAGGSGNGDAMMVDQGAGASSALGNALHDKIMDVLKQYHDLDEGANIHQVVHQLSNVSSEDKIREAIEYLINEGLCYTTTNDDHIKSTESY